jgi:hypothetical protein
MLISPAKWRLSQRRGDATMHHEKLTLGEAAAATTQFTDTKRDRFRDLDQIGQDLVKGRSYFSQIGNARLPS